MANIKGDDTDETIVGSAGADIIQGGGGSDTISGGAGDDTIYGDGVTITPATGATTSPDTTDSGQRVLNEPDSNTSESGPVVEALDDGNFMVIWYEKADGSANGGHVKGKIVDADGNDLSGVFDISDPDANFFGVRTNDLNDLPPLDATLLENGSVIITYQSGHSGAGPTSNSHDDYGTALKGIIVDPSDPTAPSVGTEFLVNETGSNTYESGGVVEALPDGGFFVAWYDDAESNFSPSTGSNSHVFGQYFDADGNKVGGQIEIGDHSDPAGVNLSETSDLPPLDITILANGDVVVSYNVGFNNTHSYVGDDHGTAIVGSVIDSSTQTAGPEFLINEGDSGIDEGPAIIEALPDGGFVATWYEQSLNASGEVTNGYPYARIFDADGNPVTDTLEIGTHDDNLGQVSGDDQHEHGGHSMPVMDMVVMDDGNIAVTWLADGSDTTLQHIDDRGTTVMGAIIDASTGTVGDEFIINDPNSNTSEEPAQLEALPGGGFAAVWAEDGGADPHNGYLQVQYFDASGEKIGDSITIGTYGSAVDARVAGDPGFDQPPFDFAVQDDGSLYITFQGADHITGVDYDDRGTALIGAHVAAPSVVSEGNGDDIIDGEEGDDIIFGGDGNDDITGGTGADTLDGGTGNDTFAVGAGDSATGGDGDDTFTPDPTLTEGTGTIDIVGGENDETNGDTLDLRGLTNVVVTPDGTDPEAGVATYEDDNGDTVTITYSEIENILVDPTPDGVVDGTTGDDVITPTSGPGGTPYTDAQGDQVDGTDGDDDIIEAGGGDDVVNAGNGNDSVDGGTGADTIAGGAGDDTLSGGAGDDDIAVGGGDVADGGSGDDVFTLDDTDPATDIDVTLDGGSDGTDGNPDDAANGDDGDTLDLSAVTDDLTVVLTAPETGTVDGLDADGTPDIDFAEIENINTGSGNDDITGSAGDDTLDAGAGDDTVDAGDGNDVVDGGAGDDTIDGGAGDDTLSGGEGSDTLTGGLGDDVLDGGDGDDDLILGAGDTALGGGGDDVFTFDPTNADGPGAITVGGGADATSGSAAGPENGDAGDILDVTGLDNVTVLSGPIDDGTGSFSGSFTYDNDDGETITVNYAEIEQLIGFAATPDGVVDGEDTGEVMGVGYDDSNLPNDGGGDLITDNADVIEGNGGDDTIDGGAGDDTIHGGTGDDTVQGGAGDDTLFGDEGDDVLVGGQGADTISGGDDQDTFVIDDVTDAYGDVVDGGSTGIDLDTLDLTGLGRFQIVAETNDADGNSTSGTVEFLDEFGDVTGTMTFEEIENLVVCFTRGTKIATKRGEVAIEDICESEQVLTLDNGFQTVRWIGSRKLEACKLAAKPNLRPIRVRKGALGAGLPQADLIVSPQHRLLLRSKVAERMFGSREVLAAAKALLGLPGIEIVTEDVGVEYWHFLFDRHELVYAEGAPTESLFTGPEALKAVSPEARKEILAIFPELAEPNSGEEAIAARKLVTVQKGKRLAHRISANHKVAQEHAEFMEV